MPSRSSRDVSQSPLTGFRAFACSWPAAIRRPRGLASVIGTLLVLAGITPSAQAPDRSKAPAPGPPPALNLPSIQKRSVVAPVRRFFRIRPSPWSRHSRTFALTAEMSILIMGKGNRVRVCGCQRGRLRARMLLRRRDESSVFIPSVMRYPTAIQKNAPVAPARCRSVDPGCARTSQGA